MNRRKCRLCAYLLRIMGVVAKSWQGSLGILANGTLEENKYSVASGIDAGWMVRFNIALHCFVCYLFVFLMAVHSEY